MNHDLAHCADDECPARLLCRRYAAHCELMEFDLEQYYPYLHSGYCRENGDYRAFLGLPPEPAGR